VSDGHLVTAQVAVVPLPRVGGGFARRLEHQGRLFAVFEVDGEPVVTDDACPHKGGPLSQGLVHDAVVTCPFHWYAFDLATGACRTSGQYELNRYPVLVRDGRWWVQIPPLKKVSWSQLLRAHAKGSAADCQ
jgi:nitrite reductase (NADH) small subunit